MKKIITIFLIISLLFACNFVYADDENLEEEIEDSAWIYETLELTGIDITNEPTINSRNAVVLDRTSRRNFVWKERTYKV